MRWCMSIFYFHLFSLFFTHLTFRADYRAFSLNVRKKSSDSYFGRIRLHGPDILDPVVRGRLKSTGKDAIARPEVWKVVSRQNQQKNKQTLIAVTDPVDEIIRFPYFYVITIKLRSTDLLDFRKKKKNHLFRTNSFRTTSRRPGQTRPLPSGASRFSRRRFSPKIIIK